MQRLLGLLATLDIDVKPRKFFSFGCVGKLCGCFGPVLACRAQLSLAFGFADHPRWVSSHLPLTTDEPPAAHGGGGPSPPADWRLVLLLLIKAGLLSVSRYCGGWGESAGPRFYLTLNGEKKGRVNIFFGLRLQHQVIKCWQKRNWSVLLLISPFDSKLYYANSIF